MKWSFSLSGIIQTAIALVVVGLSLQRVVRVRLEQSC